MQKVKIPSLARAKASKMVGQCPQLNSGLGTAHGWVSSLPEGKYHRKTGNPTISFQDGPWTASPSLPGHQDANDLPLRSSPL